MRYAQRVYTASKKHLEVFDQEYIIVLSCNVVDSLYRPCIGYDPVCIPWLNPGSRLPNLPVQTANYLRPRKVDK